MKKILVLMAIASCGNKSPSAPPSDQKDGAEGLKAVFETAAKAYEAKDLKKTRELLQGVVPDREALKKVLKDDAPAGAVDLILERFRELPADDERAARLLVPGEGRTEIKVYAGTTEELIAYKSGSTVHAEFPAGAKRLAETLLKPGVTLYEVEITEPGKDAGTKLHLFFWDGNRWRMLGPAWRAVKEPDSSEPEPPK